VSQSKQDIRYSLSKEKTNKEKQKTRNKRQKTKDDTSREGVREKRMAGTDDPMDFRMAGVAQSVKGRQNNCTILE
jgi:hypothetical protein